MFVGKIFYKNFRNFDTFDSAFGENANLIIAPNGSGKTNILESIQILSLGKSLRAINQIDLIQHGLNSAYIKADVKGNILDYQITKTDYGNRLTKTLIRNKKKVSSPIFTNIFISLWFSAESMNVINASSSTKRDFLDDFIGSINKMYFDILKKYKQVLHQKHLLLTKNEVLDLKNYYYLNKLLIKYGTQIIQIRNSYVVKLKEKLSTNLLHRYFYTFNFHPNTEISEIFEEDIEAKLQMKIDLYKDRELASRRCLVGPHKDTWDLSFSVKKDDEMHDLGIYASRGQKRIGVLNILISFLRIVEEETGQKPILLLDDITSELDQENIKIVENMLNEEGTQSFLTTTSEKIFSKGFLKQSKVIKL